MLSWFSKLKPWVIFVIWASPDKTELYISLFVHLYAFDPMVHKAAVRSSWN